MRSLVSTYTFSRVPVHNLHPEANLHRVQICITLMSRSYANNTCTYAPRFDKILIYEEKFAVFECCK